jgi:hypothetical protein
LILPPEIPSQGITSPSQATAGNLREGRNPVNPDFPIARLRGAASFFPLDRFRELEVKSDTSVE